MVSHVEGEREVTAMAHVERREASDGMDGSVVGYLEMGEVTGPTRVDSRDSAGKEKMAKGSVETLGKANSLMVGSCGRL